MASLLFNNILRDNPYTIVSENVSQKIGHEFRNIHDDQSHTTYKQHQAGSTVNQNNSIILDFGTTVQANGWAVSGHNFVYQGIKNTGASDYTNQSSGIRIAYSNNNSSYQDFTSSLNQFAKVKNSYGFIRNELEGHGDEIVSFRYLRIRFQFMRPDTFIKNLSIGVFLHDIPLHTPFVPPAYGSYETTTLENNNGVEIINNVKKTPIVFSLNLKNLTEEKLHSTVSIGDFTGTWMEYIYQKSIENPFYLYWEDYSKSTYALQHYYWWYLNLDQKISHPQFKKPTFLDWKISVKGYQL